jgi:hypothetical protein
MRKFRISIAQTFLETARSVQNVGLLIDRAKKKQISEMTEDDAAATLALAVSSISIIYSVLAVESFVNYQLYSLWKRSRETSGKPKGTCSTSCPTDPLLGKFYKEYGLENRFVQLKGKKGIRELPERIKTICKYLPVIPIHAANPKLWQEFLALVEKSRHFLVHSYPDPELVQGNLDRMLMKEPLDLHPRVAASVIRHFYVQRGGTPPAWLDKNKVFRFSRIEFPIS